MKQVVQSVSGGEVRIVEVPRPEPAATEVLVAVRRSLLSAGTERAVRELASASLLSKARARPDLVRQVVHKARTDGVRTTLAAVRGRLDEDMPLGYSAAGVVVTAGAATDGIRPGTRVATASAGHAEYQAVPGLLAVPVPDAVSDQAAAFGAVAAIALQGLRQAEVGVGGTVAVVGLGLVGQLSVRLALASGLRVIGVDLRGWTAELATSGGATGLVEAGAATTEEIMEMTRGRGVDAVLITAATRSSGPVTRSAEIARDRARLVVVGDVGLELDRRTFYERELDLRFARSYGPGRYDRTYEEWGVDYPIGHVRWTARGNIETYLDLVASRRIQVDDLVTHVFEVEQASAAYEALAADPRSLAVQLRYAAAIEPAGETVLIRPRRGSSRPRAGLIGAGLYARATFLPALKAAGWAADLTAVTSAKGLTARHLAERNGIASVTGSVPDLLGRDDVDVVFILSRHDSHADLARQALDAGKHVFVEKPLALTQDELDEVSAAYHRNSGHLFVGFNRRHAPMVSHARRILAAGEGPVTVAYRINAGRLPDSHWYHDRRQGGRIRGEVCHFVDLASWLVGREPSVVHAYGSGRGELGLEEDVSILLGYPDGSTATITYCTRGNQQTSKERVEILGRGHTVVIDDFRRLEVDGREIRRVAAGKGHQQLLAQVRQTIVGQRPDERETEASFATTRTVLAVIAALAGGPGPGSIPPTRTDAEVGVSARFGS
ncbi:Gfo/Idh/MocA family oxidoreductase [Micromonospora sp. NPDC051196]|uniref:Gfo/Idh/MocA family oxidoreductase n=1 Tax=Micromonospora sp. NPDC051196 TaxID=3155281 RepID=UPI0034136F47